MTPAKHIVPAEDLPNAIALQVSIPFMFGSISLAACYGSSFFLVDALTAVRQNDTTAGAVVSIGTIATILCSLLAGRIADVLGVMRTITLAAAIMALAMVCFASASLATLIAYIGGLLLGIGWSVFYILAPLQIFCHVRAEARIKYLTLLSASQMLGIGLAAPLARALAEAAGSYIAVYCLFAAACLAGAALLESAGRVLAQAPQIEMPAVRLTFGSLVRTFKANTRYPVIMIGIAACVFAGLSTFQTLYATSRAQSADTFFLVFTLTAVFSRFAVAPIIGLWRLERVAAFLILCTIAGLFVLLMNVGSPAIYILGTMMFALGYGLSYSTLNSMVVHIAAIDGSSLAVASQVFTLSYFIGLFGFPYIAGQIIGVGSFDYLLMSMMLLVGANGALLTIQVFVSGGRH
ncbi:MULTISPECIES: MFS transporter [Bradyrhizobium]|uniref:MFS transporter n=1 Tax=Bradyrhizobium TaxID=374 RepID=UPI00140DA860|nr:MULTISPECIES: MFS transporter [Bradyrhizobium]MCK7667359.1 MFS transporter [Bradyrhizobium sp. 2S1]UGY25755.1 MFS transporter [Bradyrhizobium septentrionale]